MELFFEPLLQLEFDNNRVLLQIEQALDLSIHSLVFVFEAHEIRQTLHEKVDTVAKSLLKLLVMADEGQHFLAEVSSCMGGEVNASANVACPVCRFVVHNLDECIHERVKRVGAVHIVVRRQLSLERDVACRQLLQSCNYLSRLLVPYFELIHFKLLPGVHLWQLLLFFEY